MARGITNNTTMPGFAKIIPAKLWRYDRKQEVLQHLKKLMLSSDSAPDAKALFSSWADFIGVETTAADFEFLAGTNSTGRQSTQE